jgi:hypothetical protein
MKLRGLDRRGKNRVQEHGEHGLVLVEPQPQNTPHNPNKLLFSCPCGWLGWLTLGIEVEKL